MNREFPNTLSKQVGVGVCLIPDISQSVHAKTYSALLCVERSDILMRCCSSDECDKDQAISNTLSKQVGVGVCLIPDISQSVHANAYSALLCVEHSDILMRCCSRDECDKDQAVSNTLSKQVGIGKCKNS
jgi:hypothetical protein